MNSAVEVLGRILIFGGAGVLAGLAAAALVRTMRRRLVIAGCAIAAAAVLATVFAVTGDRDSMDSLAEAAVIAVVTLNTLGFVVVVVAACLVRQPNRK